MEHDDVDVMKELAVLAVGLGDAGIRELEAMRASWPDHYGCHFMLGEGPRGLHRAGRPDIVFCFSDTSSTSARHEAMRLERGLREVGSIFVSVPLGGTGERPLAERVRVLTPRLGVRARAGDVARTALGFRGASIIDVVPDDVLAIYKGMNVGVVSVARGDLDVAPGLLRRTERDVAPLLPKVVFMGGGCGLRMVDIRRVLDIVEVMPDGAELLATIADGVDEREVLVGVVATAATGAASSGGTHEQVD